MRQQNRNRLTKAEDKLVVARGEGIGRWANGGRGVRGTKVQLENNLVTGMGVQSHYCNSLVGGQVITTLTWRAQHHA